MPAGFFPSALSRLWSRKGVRRLTYVLASGATLAGLAGFLATRTWTDRWLIRQLDSYLRSETGLAFQAEACEISLYRGRFIFHGLSLGGDLFQADRLEVQVELGSLFRLPHIQAFALARPRLILDQEHLARLKLKEHPPRKEPLKVQVDRIDIQNGSARVAEPAWGLPAGNFSFRVHGKGWSPNQVWLDVQVPAMDLGDGKHRLQGDLALKGMFSDHHLELSQAQVNLGRNSLDFHGSYAFASRTLRAAATGSLNLGELLVLANPGKPAAASGSLAGNAQAEGPLDQLSWKASLQGKDLQAKGLPLQPGNLRGSLSGAPGLLQMEQLQWESADGKLTGQGSWTRKGGSSLTLAGEGISLARVAGSTRTSFLKDLSLGFQVKGSLPGAPWDKPRLDLLAFQGSGQFLQNGLRVGGLEVAVSRSEVLVKELELDLPAAELHGKASALLARGGLRSLAADGDISTDAKDVADILKVWDIGSRDAAQRLQPFEMEGQTRATAQFSWSPDEGIQLKGHADVVAPRWHGARADKLGADVSIDRNVLRVTDIQLEKGQGQGYGDLWLTWADLPPGAEAMDMCYQVTRLPIHDGLMAADLGDLPISGTGSGWVRLHGPFAHILMEGGAVAEAGQAYGFTLPAVSSDFFMDLETLRLKTMDTRVADSLEHLSPSGPLPLGPLALKGSMDMDIPRQRWAVTLDGQVDSKALGLPGPQAQAWVEARLDGPFTAPFGPYEIPTGSLSFSHGRLSQGQQDLGDVEGSLAFGEGKLSVQAGLEGMPQRILSLEARQMSQALAGTVAVNLSPETADTAKLATELSQNLLKDAKLEYQASGHWGAKGFDFKGILGQCSAQFEGFQLIQTRPGQLNGNGHGMQVDLELEGHTDLTAFDRGAPVKGPSITIMSMKGSLPFSPDGPLDLQLAGSANMANLKKLLDRMIQPGQYSLLADMHPGGVARVDLDLGGTVQDATLDGTLNVQDGNASVRTYPQSIENVDFTAHFHGRDIIIPQSDPLTCTLAQGAVKAWGQVSWQRGGLSHYDLHANVEDFQFRDIPEGFDLQGSLDATLKGSDRDGGLLKGSLWAKHMAYRADINLSDLLLANAFGSTPAFNSLDPSDPLARIDLDLDLHLAEPWELDTNLLKLQGQPRGNFKVMGTLAQPGLKGKMDFLPGGRVTNLLPAGDIVLERGSVEFKDPAVLNPNIDLQGRVDVPPYLVNLAITGTLDSIQATPTSTPSLKQNEIFAILIDPDSASTVGSAPTFSSQAAMNTGLASTSTGLLSSLALANFQEGLRKTFKLDRMSVAFRSSVGATETSIIVGKNYNIMGYRIPLVVTHVKAGDVSTLSGQIEWRFGNFVLQWGASQTTGSNPNLAGEIRHTWTPD